MREKKGSRIHLICLTVCCLLGFVFWCETRMVAQAKNDSFKIEATKLPANEETYDIQLNIENQGDDWEGTVRLVVDEEYRCASAYDTVLSLPQGSTKQFIVKVPVISMEDTNGTITVSLLDKKQEVVAEKVFKRFLKEEDECLVMGILSDDYAALTYLDMGGQEMYFYNDEYPIKLVEITQDNLLTTLETLEFLVIDTYNTGVLTDEELGAIETWNFDGGILIVGTGAHAENTLAGFQNSYLGVECVNIVTPDEITYYDYSDYVNMSLLTMAELKETNSYLTYNVQYFNHMWSCSLGDGAVGILPYSLTELATMGDAFYTNVDSLGFVREILEMVSGESRIRYNSSTYNNYYNYNILRRMLRMIGNVNSSLHFGILKVLVILYVIFVGPALYIILKMAKKKELYWVAVPVSALLGIVLVFFAGRGFEVVDTRVYSVTTENLSGDKAGKSYLYCYDASNREWALELSEGYEYAGALMNEQYGYEEGRYYHHIQREGDRLSVGIRPSSSFEDSFFYAGKKGEAAGSIECYGVGADDMSGIWGSITNATDRDFAYYAVIADNTLYVYEGLKTGESQDLTKQVPIYTTYRNNDIWHSYMYDFLNDIRDEMEPEEVSALSALGVGVTSLYMEEDATQTIVIGVVENWNQTVNDKCSEMSFGCLYVKQ